MSKRNHFHHYSRSTEPPEIIRRHHRNLPGRAVQIGRIRAGAHYKRFKEIVAEVEEKSKRKCAEKHLYWISRIITKSCTNIGQDGKPDPIIEWPKSVALLEGFLFLRKTFPDAEEFAYRKRGPRKSGNLVAFARNSKEIAKGMARRLNWYVPEDDKNGQKGPYDHDETILQPEPMTLHNEASRKAKAAEEAAKEAAEKADEELKRLLKRNRYKTERDEKKRSIKDKNPTNPYARERREDEESIVTDSDFVGNYRDRNEADNDPPPEEKPRVHRYYYDSGYGSSSYSDSDSDSSTSSMYPRSVRDIYGGRRRHYKRRRRHEYY
ncbi:hypothetical protein ACHAPF_002808 [Botrytis cinerea]